MKISKKIKNKYRINEEIKSKEIRLCGPKNENIGVLNIETALKLAKDQNIDLIEIAPNANPPVVRLMSYEKFKYYLRKKDRKVKCQNKPIIKEMKFRPNTDHSDYNFKLKKLIKFLSKNKNKTRITIQLKGREIDEKDISEDIINRIKKDLEEYSTIDQLPQLKGKQIIMLFSPK